MEIRPANNRFFYIQEVSRFDEGAFSLLWQAHRLVSEQSPRLPGLVVDDRRECRDTQSAGQAANIMYRCSKLRLANQVKKRKTPP